MPKVVLITGASRGIGFETARCFAKAGYEVAMISSKASPESLTEIESITKARSYTVDVRDGLRVKACVKQVLEDFGTIDVLINNAGITRDGLLLQMSEEDFSDVIDVNLKGAFLFTKEASRHMLRRKQGSIINVSSMVALTGNAGQTNYAASKAGLIGFTKSVAKELAPKNITCNAVAPGFIETSMTKDLNGELLSRVPLKRAGTPADVAALCLFLASEGAAYITGEVIRVDGGLGIV